VRKKPKNPSVYLRCLRVLRALRLLRLLRTFFDGCACKSAPPFKFLRFVPSEASPWAAFNSEEDGFPREASPSAAFNSDEDGFVFGILLIRVIFCLLFTVYCLLFTCVPYGSSWTSWTSLTSWTSWTSLICACETSYGVCA